MQDAPEEADFVIIGAGSAGCVLASRLSEDAGVTVAILEAGPRDNSLVVKMPAGAGQLMPYKGPYNWGFDTAPQRHLNDRRLYWPRGRGLGGSSNINGMVYIRGHGRDYDQWRQMGLSGWGYRDVLPYFKKLENFEDGADAWHGDGGPLSVSRPRSNNPLFKAFIQAGLAAGYPATRDFNGYAQEGFGPIHATMRDGERCSASRAYLHPALKRPNLAVVPNARATRILIENNRARGVEFSASPGAPRRVIRARKEVLLAGGTVQSPPLLHLSGIGPADHLRSHGIPVAVNSPGVGGNLQDHLDLAIVHRCSKPITAYNYVRGIGQLRVGLAYLLSKSGPGRFSFLESGGFVKTRPELEIPDIQLHFVAAIVDNHARTKFNFDGFTLHACQLRPESRGFVGAASPDPFADPLIDPNYLATELDRRTMRDCVNIGRAILAQKPLAPFREEEVFPGAHVRTDAEIDAFVREKAETIYHPVGSCRMGADPDSVVDAELRVRGVDGLRVVDASIMPTLVGGNTNAPTIMIAEKAADMIRGRAALPAEDAPIAEDALQLETTKRKDGLRLASGV